MDNFEWAEGYSQRFGLAYVDFRSQKRTLKDSGKWYGQLAATGKLRRYTVSGESRTEAAGGAALARPPRCSWSSS